VRYTIKAFRNIPIYYPGEITSFKVYGLIDGDGSFNISFPQKLESGKIKPVLSLCLGKNAASLFFKEIIKILGPKGVLTQSNSIVISHSNSRFG